MKVFFNASIAGKNKHLQDYKIVINAIKELGHTVYSNHVIKNECDREDLKLEKDYRKYSKSIKDLLSKSDVVVTETSFPSIMVGFVLCLALQQRKSVLALFQNNPHRILVGDNSKLLTLRRYRPDQYQRLKKILSKFFDKDKNKSLHIRFNLMINKTLNRTIEKKSRKENISKADYIRRVIEEDIDNNSNEI